MIEPQPDFHKSDRDDHVDHIPDKTYDNLILFRVSENGTYISTAGQIGKYGIYLIGKFEKSADKFAADGFTYPCREGTAIRFVSKSGKDILTYENVKTMLFKKFALDEAGKTGFVILEAIDSKDNILTIPIADKKSTEVLNKSEELTSQKAEPINQIENGLGVLFESPEANDRAKKIAKEAILPEETLMFDEIPAQETFKKLETRSSKKQDPKIEAKLYPVQITEEIENALWSILLAESKKQQYELITKKPVKNIKSQENKIPSAGWATAMLAKICSADKSQAEQKNFLENVIKHGELVDRVFNNYKPATTEYKIGKMIQVVLNPENASSRGLADKLLAFFSDIPKEYKLLKPFFHKIYTAFAVKEEVAQIGVSDRNLSLQQILARLEDPKTNRLSVIGALTKLHGVIKLETARRPKDGAQRKEHTGLMNKVLDAADKRKDMIVNDRERKQFLDTNKSIRIRLNRN